MVIVIKGSDFSSNNLGQITLPIYWDTDALAYTAKIPTAFAAMSDAKKRALNKFFKGLKSAGIYSKITHLYLPIFGQSEGGINLITPTQNIGFPVSGPIATYSNNGVYFLQGWQVPFSKNLLDVHAGFYNTTACPDVDQLRLGIASGGNDFWVGRRISSPKNAGFLLNAVLPRIILANHMTSIGAVIGTTNFAANYTATQVDGEYGTIAQAYNGNNSTFLKLGYHTVGSNTFLLEASVGLYTFGSSLAQTELATYSALQTSLMTALLAA